MEAAGLMDHFPCIVIRGICDYSDTHKNDTWQGYAAVAAAAYAKELLRFIRKGEVLKDRAAGVEQTMAGGPEFNLQGSQFHRNVNFGGIHHDETDGLQYLRRLNIVNPEDERRRILTTKDKLVPQSYAWILQNKDFQYWRNGTNRHLLWIKGGPGKGKTMMMAGLVDLLERMSNESTDSFALSYFFCQNADAELRKVTSILKGLIYMLAFRERSLIYHLREKYEAGGEEIFTGPRALFTLWHILKDMLAGFRGQKIFLMVDGLDECDDAKFDQFLELIADWTFNPSGKVKWVVTSRPLPRIENHIGPDGARSRISLEIESQNMSHGVEIFIEERVGHLSRTRNWNSDLAGHVHSYLKKNAGGTFLWVALVCKRLQQLPLWKVRGEIAKLADLQLGLDSFYHRMLKVVRDEIPESAELCVRILRATTLVYCPLSLQELGNVVALPQELQEDDSPTFDGLRDLIERCGSFLLLHRDMIYFVHQSAKDYFDKGAGSEIFTSERSLEHVSIARKCLDTLISNLEVCRFPDPTSLDDQGSGEDKLRSLSRTAYACSHWIHHTIESVGQGPLKARLPNEDKILNLLDTYFIPWIHSLGSLKEIGTCIIMVKALLQINIHQETKHHPHYLGMGDKFRANPQGFGDERCDGGYRINDGGCRINDIAFSPNQKVLAAGYEDGSIRLLGMENCALIRTLETKWPVLQFTFDSKSRFIWTGEEGFFLDDCTQHCSEHEPKETDVSIVEDWVLLRGKRVLWLPPEYRAERHTAVCLQGNSLIIGHRSGDVTYISFDL